MQTNAEDIENRRWLVGFAACFAAVHALYFIAGVRFDRGTLVEVMHFLDAELLRDRLLESVWYLHIQPPLLNLFTGLILKVTPESALLFHAIFLACGFLLYWNVFRLQVKLGVGRPLAAALATVFMASPSFILWEHYLLYTMPIAALLSGAAVCLLHYLEGHAVRWLAGYFGCVVVLCGIASMFHLVYFLLALGGVLFFARVRWRQVLAVALLPFCLVFGFYLKNFLVFGEFNVCTFAEKNLWIMTAGNMPWDEKTALVEAGTLSELSLVNRWASLDAYPDRFKQVPVHFAGIPALAATHKANGSVNYNHYGYIANCDVYGADAKYVLRHHPWHFVVASGQSWYRYFKSSSDLPVSPQNQDTMRPAIAFYDYAVYGKSPIDLSGWLRIVEKTGSPPYFFLLLGLPLVWGYGLWRGARPGARGFSTPQRAVVLFLVLNIAYVAILGCSLDYLETARYRFTTDGLSVVLLGMLLGQLTVDS